MKNDKEMSEKMNEFLDKVDALCFEYGYEFIQQYTDGLVKLTKMVNTKLLLLLAMMKLVR